VVREFLPREHLLSYLEAILRVYNLEGRRDNLTKARIKILVKALGIEEFRRRVEAEWELIRDGGLRVDDAEVERMRGFFTRLRIVPCPTWSRTGQGNRVPGWYRYNTWRTRFRATARSMCR